MINVYAANATDFTSNGIATLEPTLCELAMTINGAWVLTLEHPFDENNKYINLDNAEPIRPELKKGNIIKVTDIAALRDCDSTQLFRIYDTVKTLTSIRVTAFPVGMEATYDSIIEELKLNNKNGKQVISELRAAADEVTSGSDIGKYTLSIESSFPTSKKRSVNYKNTNLIAALCGSDEGSFVNKFNAEVAYNNYEIKVKKRLGSGTDYDVRLGKNLTGLSFEIDDSAVVTRLYPISQDDLRLKDDTDRRYIPGHEIRYIDSENESYPYVRAAFVEVPYSLIDTDIEAQVPTATAVLTETVYNAVYDEIYRLMYEFWTDILEDNEFSYTGTVSFDISLIPEFVQANIKDVSEAVANNVLGTSLDNVYVAHPGLRSWLTNAIRAGMDWISEIDLPEKGWIENQDGSYSYGTDLRNLKNEWAYIDRKMSYFNNNEKWEKKKDDSYEWDWVQKKGQRKKFGNNKRYLARNTYVYDYDGGCKYYWFDEEGWWDGTSESSGWAWHQNSTGWWFGDADPDGDDSKYIHDDWAFIRETADSPRKLYYFNSDGYLDGEEVVDWNWHKVNGKRYFGSTNHENRATYLVSQWMQIEGDWRLFDSNGYVEDLETTKAALISALSIYLQEEVGSLIGTEQNALFDLLYSNMEEYCNDLYESGLDKPSINVSVDFVDLSKTQEYAAYSNLEKICLGDDVEVHDPVHGIDAITERVMGLTYDCIRGYNTKIEVGGVSSVTSLFDTSVKGTGNEQRFVAGENVTINGNVINVSANTGDVYAGDKVSVTQLQTTGQPIAKIYVNGMPTTIYAVGSDVEVEPIKTEGDKIATITVGGVDYDIYADTGLKYWVETQTDIYRTGTRDGISGSDTYLKTSAYMGYGTNTVQPDYEVRKGNNNKALIAWVLNANAQNYCYGMFFVSTKNNDAEWEWRRLERPYHQDPYYSAWMEPAEQGQMYSLWDETASFTYKGATWYVHKCPTAQNYTIPSIESIPYNSGEQSIIDTAKRIIDLANAEPYTEDIVGISNQDHILYYNDDKKNNYDTENRDDAVYISKDGIFNGSEFRVNGVAIGSFYKTRLYLGSSYAASITLSDSYTAYDLLMIETYNQDDKKNLASMVNVSDLANSSYVGVDGYLMYTITNGRTLTFHEAPTDTNHSRYIKAIYGLRTGHDSGTESPIEDVTVDGESVVSGGVAVIDLSSKQDALTAGNNVQISNQGVISATDTTYSDFAGSSHGLVPSASSGDSSKYLKGDGTWGTPDTGTTYTAGANIQISEQNVISATDTTYSDFDGTNSGLVPEPQSGDSGYLKSDGTWDEPEGTTVIANPSGTAIDTLTKIQVENTIYDIASGSYIEVATSILQSYTEWTEKYTSGMVAYYSSDKIYFATASYTDSDRAMAVYKVQIPASVKKIRYSITQKRTDAQDPTQDMYKLCVGVKNSYDDVNYSTPTDSDFLVKNLHEFEAYNVVTNGELDISSISNTVYLYIIANGFACEVTKVEVVEYKAGLEDLSDVNISNPSNGQVLTYDSNNQEWVNANASGGTTVVANPSESATATLTKLQVENTIYEVSGGASDIDDLSDVNITTPSNGQVLQYDSANSKWINATPSGGGGISTFSGTAEPTSTIGDDGDLYFKLRINGTISKAYVKINGTWTIYTSNSLPVSWTKLSNLRAISTSGAFSGQNAVFSLTSYADYQNIGTDNIIIQWNSYYHSNAFGVTPCTISKTYNSATGELSITTPICPFYQGKYTIDVIIASGEILNKQVSPSSMSGNTAYYDLSNIYGYSELGVNDIAFEMDEITHATNYNLQHNITYSYDSSNGIFSASTDTSIFLNSKATIAIKKSNE